MSSTEHSSPSVPNGSLLLVDDDDAVRRMLRLALQAADFEVIDAGTQLELQRRLADTRPDALILDLHRSTEADALDLLVRMRARQSLSTVPILFLAGYDDDDFRRQILRAGADWFGLRPVAMSKLRTYVADLVRNGRPTTHTDSATRIIRLQPTG